MCKKIFGVQTKFVLLTSPFNYLISFKRICLCSIRLILIKIISCESDQFNWLRLAIWVVRLFCFVQCQYLFGFYCRFCFFSFAGRQHNPRRSWCYAEQFSLPEWLPNKLWTSLRWTRRKQWWQGQEVFRKSLCHGKIQLREGRTFVFVFFRLICLQWLKVEKQKSQLYCILYRNWKLLK